MSDDPRWGDDPRDRRDDDWRERDDEDALAVGRGPGSSGPRDDQSEDDRRNRGDDSRGFERDRDSRNRDESLDPRDVFMRDLDLPRRPDREIVHDARDREHTLRGSETRTLSTVGAFRVVSARDLRDHNGRPADPRSGDLRHLREEGLIRTERCEANMMGTSARSDERLPQVPERTILIRQAFRLEWLTVAWMVVEALVAIGSGVVAGSLTLTAFGLDSLIELVSAGVLIWRLTQELRHGEEFSRHAERIASRIGGALLLVLAAYIVLGAAWSFWAHHGGAFTLPGLIVAAVAMPVMYVLARRKVDVARRLGSRSMRADAIESMTCGWLSLVVVVGLVANLLLAAWWIDAVTSLGIVWFVVQEAREAWSGEDCCSHE